MILNLILFQSCVRLLLTISLNFYFNFIILSFQASFKRDRETGLHDVSYAILSQRKLVIDGFPCTILNVHLGCDKMVTPWCDFPSKKH